MATFDIAVEVVINDYPDDNNDGIERGDFVTVVPAEQVAVKLGNGKYEPLILPVPMPRTGWIFITDIPDTISFDRVRNVLISAEINYTFVPPKRVKNKKFKIPVAAIPATVRNALVSNRYYTISFIQAKDYVQHKTQLRALQDTDF